MKKIPTLFTRDQSTKRVLPTVTPGCEWVLADEGVATKKWDGTACLVQGGQLFKRYELKKGKPTPENFVPAQVDPDPITGDLPGWLPVGNGPEDRYHREAWDAGMLAAYGSEAAPFSDGTYELIGPKIQSNPEHFTRHALIPHGRDSLNDAPRDYDALRDYLAAEEIEGIVWWRDTSDPDCDKAKLKGRDFGIKRGQ